MRELTIYEADYWASRYLETYSNPRARQRLADEIGAEWGDSLLEQMMLHWKSLVDLKKLADQPTRPVLRAGMTEAAHARVKRTMDKLFDMIAGWQLRAEQAEATLKPATACGDKCTSHPCPCGHPERHCLGCSGESVNGKPADSKPATPGSSPGSPATHRERLIRHVTALLGWRDEVKFISVHYKSGAVATCDDGMFSSYMPANFKPRIVRVESTHEAHQTAASFDACPECNPKQKCDHLPEGSH